MFEDIEHVIREKQQREDLRDDLLEKAFQEWMKDPNHNYSRAAKKYGLNFSTFYYFVQRKRLEQVERSKDTDYGLKTVTLQFPK